MIKESKEFFFSKKNQKTFFSLGLGGGEGVDGRVKPDHDDCGRHV
jgi:hypothetical protein